MTAPASNQAAHGGQAMEGQFEPDQKKQKNDTKIGDARDVLRVANRNPLDRWEFAAERSEAERPEERTGAEIAENRINA
jgi:hypothetical protein